jgi:hypothetical protein
MVGRLSAVYSEFWYVWKERASGVHTLVWWREHELSVTHIYGHCYFKGIIVVVIIIIIIIIIMSKSSLHPNIA